MKTAEDLLRVKAGNLSFSDRFNFEVQFLYPLQIEGLRSRLRLVTPTLGFLKFI